MAIILGGAAAVGFLVILMLFARNLMKKRDGMYYVFLAFLFLFIKWNFFIVCFFWFNLGKKGGSNSNAVPLLEFGFLCRYLTGGVNFK